jgi:hypothetical protein
MRSWMHVETLVGFERESDSHQRQHLLVLRPKLVRACRAASGYYPCKSGRNSVQHLLAIAVRECRNVEGHEETVYNKHKSGIATT